MNNNIWDLLNIISIVLGYENLMENRQQSEANNAEERNQKELLDDLREQFDKQNKVLEYQTRLLEKILKGGNDNV